MDLRRALIGTLVSIDSTNMAECLSVSGLDWLFFDMEHAPLTIPAVQRMIQAVRPPCLSFIRIAAAQPVHVRQALDTGCDGIIIPQVNSAETARSMVNAGKYAPLGNRGMGLSRSNLYGLQLAEALRGHNEEKSILLQIEHIDGVEKLEEILAVPGVDGVFVGPYDLSNSMGLSGEVNHPQVQAAVQRVASAAAKRGMPAGIFIASDEVLPREMERGFGLIAVGSDTLRLASSCRATVAVSRGGKNTT